MTQTYQGQCLCGAVRLEGSGKPTIAVCNCGQCRTWTGGIGVGVTFEGGVRLVRGDTLKWYSSSEWAERGFCSECGTSILYRLKSDPVTFYPQAGAFDLPDGLEIAEHIFIDDKPDYYEFADHAPRLTGAETLAKYQSE